MKEENSYGTACFLNIYHVFKKRSVDIEDLVEIHLFELQGIMFYSHVLLVRICTRYVFTRKLSRI